MSESSQDELLDRARRVIRDLREKLSAAEARSRPEPIAVIGMGLRFPGCGDDPEAFWRMIVEGRDAVAKVPRDRWDREAYYAADAPTSGRINTRHASFLDDVRRFDAAFFDTTPAEAARMDPQQRIFMETAWHALEDAGLTKARLMGSDTGVFVGVHSQSTDYLAMQYKDPALLDAYSGTGSAHDVIAGRLAYWLDLHGPAVAVNTACSSSLVAVHLACRSLRTGDCTVALAAGVNLLLAPLSTVIAAQLQLLSPDGRCKAFDARADGMGRGEGCGVVVLKKLSDARRDGDRVLAVVRGSAVNQDGKTNGLTAPNGLAQQRVLRRALEDAGIDAGAVGYVETHGTGTSLGDPIEVEALGEVLGRAHKRTSALTLGAVKANVGHLEGAAGIAGFVKAVMVLGRRWLPPVANLERLNPHLVLDGSGIEIPKQGRAWDATPPRIAGVSSFGWSGTNAHVILEEAEEAARPAAIGAEWPVLISAQSAEALRPLANAFAVLLDAADAATLASVSYTTAVRRTHHAFRIAVSGGDGRAVAAALRQRMEGAASGEHGGSGTKGVLEEKLRAWEEGAEVAWEGFVSPSFVATLPVYPFQGREHWLETMGTAAPEREQSPAEWFYRTEWVEKPLEGARKKPSAVVLVYSEGGEVARVVNALRQREVQVVEVLLRASEDRLSSGRGVAGNDVSAEVARVLAELPEGEPGPCQVLYFAGGCGAERIVEDALGITTALAGRTVPTGIYFVTQGADGPARSDSMNMQAALRGFSRVLGLEYPELAGGVIDIGCDGSGIGGLCEEMETASGEDRVALRAGQRWVPRIRRDRLTLMGESLALSDDRSYLVTGAFGGLGIEIASWLVRCGARHLVLLGRRSPEEMGSAKLLRQIERWRSQGISVVAEACDVAEEQQVRRVLESVAADGFSLAGVIHAAARLSMRPLAEFSPEDVRDVFRAKVEGARVLDRLTRTMDLDFFVLFSSAAATIGLRNGALYAAASSCLSEVVRERREQGHAGLCIEWGSWEYEGADERRTLIGRSGFEEMPAAQAMKAMERLLLEGRGDGLVAAIDWSVLGPALEMRGRQALVEDFLVEQSAAEEYVAPSHVALSSDGFAGLANEDRRDRVCNFVSGEVRKIFGMRPDEFLDESRGLFQMGMDSLMSVRLKRALEAGTGLRLPGTLTLLYPNVSALAAFLEERLVPQTATAEPAKGRGIVEERRDSVGVSTMGDEETSAAIAAEIAAIQKLGVL